MDGSSEVVQRPRDQAAALLEQMSQRDIRQLAEYCVDHLDDVGEWKSLADYLRLHIVLNAAKSRPGVFEK